MNKTCTVYVQVFVACLRALRGPDGATSEDTCNTLRQVSDFCGEIPNAHKSISVLLSMTNCSSDTKLTMLTTATPPRNATPTTDRFHSNYPPKRGIQYIGRYTDLHCVNADLSLFSTLVFILHTCLYSPRCMETKMTKSLPRPLGVTHCWLSLRKMTGYSPGHKLVLGTITWPLHRPSL